MTSVLIHHRNLFWDYITYIIRHDDIRFATENVEFNYLMNEDIYSDMRGRVLG